MRLLSLLALLLLACSSTGFESPIDPVAADQTALLRGTFNQWTARGPYPDSFTPFTHSAGIAYAGTPDRNVQNDLDLLVGSDGFRMLHIYRLFSTLNLDVDPQMAAVINYASAHNVEILLGTLNGLVTGRFQTRAGADQYVAAAATYLNTGVVKVIALGNEPNDRNNANIPPATFAVAARNLRGALDAAGFDHIPVSVCLLYGGIVSYPPANAAFAEDGGSFSPEGYIRAIEGLSSKPFIFINLFPHFAVQSVTAQFPDTRSWYPDFGLFRSQVNPATHDGNLAPYWALADLQFDTVRIALDRAHLDHVQVYIGETGWPDTAGAAEQAAYITNLLNLWVGPQREAEGVAPPVFLFRGFDQPSLGPAEGHWGIRRENGTLKPGIALPNWLPN